MKPSYDGFSAKENKGFLDVPPVGCYVAQILNVRFVPAGGNRQQKDCIELFLDITEGEYKGRYMELWNNEKERRGDKAFYKGIYRLTPPVAGDEAWKKTAFEGDLWCVEQSNGFEADGKTPLYRWDWDEAKLKGKKVGINVRKKLYTSASNGKDYETTEICKFETVSDVIDGKCKPKKDNDRRTSNSGSGEQNFTDVSSAQVDVPW